MVNPLSKTLWEDKPPILKRVGRAAAALATATATLLSGVLTTGTAFATTNLGLPG